MIRVIEATPGAGKTNIVVEWLCAEVDKGFYDEIYTSINGLRIVGVKSIGEDFDWRTLNPINEVTGERDSLKRLVVYDEAQYEKAFMKENRSVNEVGKDLSTHRHYGMDIWLITQSSTLLNSYVHANTGEHVFMYRPRKKKTVKVYWWSHIQKSLSKEAFKTADDEQTWRLNPSMFPLYKSTSGVTDGQTRKSTKLFSVLLTAVLVFGFIGFMIKQGASSFSQMKNGVDTVSQPNVLTVDPNAIAGELSSSAPSPVAPVAPVSPSDSVAPVAPLDSSFLAPAGSVPVSAAMVNGECWAYDVKALRVVMPPDECVLYIPVYNDVGG